ncbi:MULTISPECIES: hypothetical protein [Bacillaceae]|uniref:hypothetical protein n=1 Tax=Bacillaceae TaxID=186817 RepID=UPI000E74B8B6|nr:hypothetical protein [Bacillus sp. PK3_68]RJS60900.1 hypothetical protein CJ483_13110 [Bacillus sp. PK3_68]
MYYTRIQLFRPVSPIKINNFIVNPSVDLHGEEKEVQAVAGRLDSVGITKQTRLLTHEEGERFIVLFLFL